MESWNHKKHSIHSPSAATRGKRVLVDFDQLIWAKRDVIKIIKKYGKLIPEAGKFNYGD